ncbi:prostatic spermine-binding protein-like [Neltuma alba]|uniref:prostatic spermine-binding protein-like n=1 Tax=Neltuma alba TaxID=207710 RepID=UPI0010A35DB4|nr:prostatic spermine-binding protein-like [Prosopis alba]
MKVQIGLNAKVKGVGNEKATVKEGGETVGDAVEEITKEVVAGSRDEELDKDETSKGDNENDEDEEEDDLHDRKGGHDYTVEEVEDEGDRDGRGGDDDDDEEDDHDDKEGGHVVEREEDDHDDMEFSHD